MNNSRPPVFRALAMALALPLLALPTLLAGCDVDSVDSTTAVLSNNEGTIYNFSGLYSRTDSNNVQQELVFPTNRQSGVKLTWLRLLQYGSVLEAYDNAGLTCSGNISGIQSTTASFSLSGRTTANQPVEIAGTMIYKNEASTMNASWIEPNFAGSIFATATVSPAATNSPAAGNVTISPTSATLTTNGASRSFSATGGSGTYSWTLTGGIGTLSPASGSPVTVTRTNSGTGILTVTSGLVDDSVSISCP